MRPHRIDDGSIEYALTWNDITCAKDSIKFTRYPRDLTEPLVPTIGCNSAPENHKSVIFGWNTIPTNILAF